MSATKPLPPHLERIGDQPIAAAESLYATGPEESRRRARPRRAFAALVRAPRLALAGGVASFLAVASVVAVLATAGATPAYVLTQNANGTYTVTISNIAAGVPALNAKLKQLGINAAAVPVTATCTAPMPTGLSERVQEQLSAASAARTTAGSDGLINLDQANISAGSEGVIAAYRSPSGQINLTFSTTSGSIPSCLNTSDVVPPNPQPPASHEPRSRTPSDPSGGEPTASGHELIRGVAHWLPEPQACGREQAQRRTSGGRAGLDGVRLLDASFALLQTAMTAT